MGEARRFHFFDSDFRTRRASGKWSIASDLWKRCDVETDNVADVQWL